VNSFEINLPKCFEDGEISNYTKTASVDKWIGTNYEGYTLLQQTQKGVFGELLVSRIMIANGSRVCRRSSRGHDRVIDGYKTEIKFSLSTTEGIFKFNHIACHKDWDRLILLGVNSDEEFYMCWIKKEDFQNNVESANNIFNRQQGGNESINDDYIFSCKHFSKLENTGITNKMDTWKKYGDKKIGIELFI
jgi:hypothetical protein